MVPTEPEGCLAPPGSGWNGLPLDSARLRLRHPRPQDAEAVSALLSDPEVARTTPGLPFPFETSHAETFVAQAAIEIAARRGIVLAIEERLSGQMVGCIGAKLSAGTAELGFWIGRPFWGRGYASEATLRCLRLLFRDCGAGLVWASLDPANGASRRVLEKAGFAAGHAADGAPPAGEAMAIMALDRPVWDERQRARPLLLVAAAALIDRDGRVLIAQRPAGKSMAGLWEFPGGKLAQGESPEAALVRELAEELAIDVTESCLAPLACASHDYDTFHLLMPLYACRQWRGQVTAREGQALAWVRAPSLAAYPMPPADIPLVAILRDWL